MLNTRSYFSSVWPPLRTVTFLLALPFLSAQARPIAPQTHTDDRTIVRPSASHRNASIAYRSALIRTGSIIMLNGNTLGDIDRNGSIRGPNGNYLGNLSTNGSVFSAHGVLLGHVSADGTMNDAQGHAHGKAASPALAAWMLLQHAP
ncbi:MULTISPECIES: hypothetical protein [unclassified Saccharibacter]|uniref:hypothetical protein n=1 Tax=unclassified Saccharibacter TaxID=2648722 RepID=UPI0013286EB7|nr:MULTISPECIES: hypothetical protein [unclassified Saccharibacter]MXV36811.1 hypothetical protein [Saccharibacter sp. EH611]MXV58699.1 hypothetical protein [Saccharibacter sp. EH70]MXV66205.1 hypothetical protein [Saccharibacter sp. EH60]